MLCSVSSEEVGAGVFLCFFFGGGILVNFDPKKQATYTVQISVVRSWDFKGPRQTMPLKRRGWRLVLVGGGGGGSFKTRSTQVLSAPYCWLHLGPV